VSSVDAGGGVPADVTVAPASLVRMMISMVHSVDQEDRTANRPSNVMGTVARFFTVIQ
jgi:hypothetical protein